MEVLLYSVEGRIPDPLTKYFDASKHCKYHIGVQGHDTKDYSLRYEIEMLIKSGESQCTPAPPNMNHNPLLYHKNQWVNMITLEEDYDLIGTIVTIGNTDAAGTILQTAPFITI